jgi:hypothetical protein
LPLLHKISVLPLFLPDVRKAHLNGTLQVKVLVKVPLDVPELEGRWVLLERNMFWCRDAASCWEAEIQEVLLKLGFGQGKTCPALWFRK